MKEGTPARQPILFIDFETCSKSNLKASGAYRYAADPTTRAVIMGYYFENGVPRRDTGFFKTPEVLQFAGCKHRRAHREAILEHVRNGGLVAAWNIEFDRLIWNLTFGDGAALVRSPELSPEYKSAMLRPEQCIDVMAMASAMGFPMKLDECAQTVLGQRKVSLPHSIERFFRDPSNDHFARDNEGRLKQYGEYCLKQYGEYCFTDVLLMRELFHRLNPLTEQELCYSQMDMRTNIRGIPLDMGAVHAANDRATKVAKVFELEFTRLTGLTPSQAVAFTRWLRSAGVECSGVGRDEVEKLLKSKDLPAYVRRALELRQLAAKSSVAKLSRMIETEVDGRIHGTLRYHAASTGRAGGKLVQPQNLPRPTLSHSEIETFKGEGFATASLSDISSCIRSMISSDRLVAADYSNIEGRVAAWVAGESWKVQAFRDFDAGHGPDLYRVAAAGIYSVPIEEVTKDMRQVGKTSELACQYGGAEGAFGTMARTFGLDLSFSMITKAVTGWRKLHPAIVRMWGLLERDARLALKIASRRTDKTSKPVGLFQMVNGNLYMRLPSGRSLCYPTAEHSKHKGKDGKDRMAITFFGQDTYTRKWGRTSTYGGKLFENLVQALARDILYHGMEKVQDEVVLHVHDEVVLESETTSLDTLVAAMCDTPEWAEGLPVKCEGWEAASYQK